LLDLRDALVWDDRGVALAESEVAKEAYD